MMTRRVIWHHITRQMCAPVYDLIIMIKSAQTTTDVTAANQATTSLVVRPPKFVLSSGKTIKLHRILPEPEAIRLFCRPPLPLVLATPACAVIVVKLDILLFSAYYLRHQQKSTKI